MNPAAHANPNHSDKDREMFAAGKDDAITELAGTAASGTMLFTITASLPLAGRTGRFTRTGCGRRTSAIGSSRPQRREVAHIAHRIDAEDRISARVAMPAHAR